MTNKIDLGTIIRTVLLILALINQTLVITGHNVLPISDDQITEFITLSFTIITAMWSWWKNNSITSAAQAADKYMKTLKEDKKV
jgi:holin, SPP1 family